MNRPRARRPHSGTVRTLLRVDCAAVLHDAVAGADVMQQEIAERTNALVAERVRDLERAAVDERSRRRGR